MRVTVSDIKYFNHIDDLVDIKDFKEYTNYLISIKSEKYLCYIYIDNYDKLANKYLNELKNSIKEKLLKHNVVDVISSDSNYGYLFIAKNDLDNITSLCESFNTKKDKVTFSIAITLITLYRNYDELIEFNIKQIDRSILQGGNNIFIEKEKVIERNNGNLVEPHLVCKYCGKITNVYQFENRVLTVDKILANSYYKTIKIHRCNRCNVASLNLREPIEFDHSVLESSDYLNILNKDIPDEEKNILLAVIIYLSIKDYLNAGMLMYFYYELTKKENAINYTLEYLDTSELIEAHILLLDFSRKIGDLNVFRGVLKYKHPKTRYHRMLINLEEYKMNNYDSGDLNYLDDISYKYFFKGDFNGHENLTNLKFFSSNNIERIRSLFTIPEEYELASVLEYNQNYYCIYVVPFIGLSRIYKIDIIKNYRIELVEDKILFDSILDEYNNIKNNQKAINEQEIKCEHTKMYFEDAMVAFANQDKEKCKEYLNKGIENNEVYAYYYADQFLLPIDYEKYEELKKEDNPYALAVKGKEALHTDLQLGLAFLETSQCGVAKYNLYRYYYDEDEEETAERYLEQALDYDFPLAYKEFAKEIRFNGRYIPIKYNGMTHLDICDKAIALGFADGYFAKAKLYEDGHCVEKDLNKAIELYKQLPDSEYSYRNMDLIRDYYQLGNYEEVYTLCLDYISRKKLFEDLAIKCLGDIYSQKSFSKFDIIKSLIYKKSLITSTQCETEVIEIANINYEYFGNLYIAQQYVNLFKKLVDYNDTCMIHYDNYLEMIYDVDEYEDLKKDDTDYYTIGRNALKNKEYKKAYDAFLAGFMLDDQKCFIELIRFYLEGIVVEKDINIVRALNKAANNELLFKKTIEEDEIEEFEDDIDCFSLRMHLQDGDDAYFNSYEETDKDRKLELLKEALEEYKRAYELGAEYVLDRINEIKKMIKTMK